MNYIDVQGRMHDRPVVDGKYSSNNGFIYSAIATKLGGFIPLDYEYARKCAELMLRNLDKTDPPISRDEILGLVALGAMTKKELPTWSFSPYPLPRFNPILLIKQLWQCKDQHRNYFWQNNLSQVYHVAFSVPLQDRHFINTLFKRFNPVYWVIAKVDSWLTPKSNSGHLIRFLKYGIMPDIKVFEEYFGEQHPITQLARQKIK
jgi:hypothetical protein